jgi:hypothetical protein
VLKLNSISFNPNLPGSYVALHLNLGIYWRHTCAAVKTGGGRGTLPKKGGQKNLCSFVKIARVPKRSQNVCIFDLTYYFLPNINITRGFTLLKILRLFGYCLCPFHQPIFIPSCKSMTGAQTFFTKCKMGKKYFMVVVSK